jgi:hypothetical protein
MMKDRACKVLIVETGSGLGGSARALGEMLRGFARGSFEPNGVFHAS